jgi:hypothetical protein
LFDNNNVEEAMEVYWRGEKYMSHDLAEFQARYQEIKDK